MVEAVHEMPADFVYCRCILKRFKAIKAALVF